MQTAADDGQQVSTYAALEASAQSGGLTKLDAVKYILLDCGMKTTQFPSGDSDYIAMAKSVGIADDKFGRFRSLLAGRAVHDGKQHGSC